MSEESESTDFFSDSSLMSCEYEYAPSRLFLNSDMPVTEEDLPKHEYLGPLSRQIEEEVLEELLRYDFVEEADYSYGWINPVVIVKKPDGRYKMCIDMRDTNKNISTSVYPIPTAEELFYLCSHKKIFSLLHMKDIYEKVPLGEDNKHKTCFKLNGMYYWYKIIPKVAKNAYNVMQKTMEDIFSEHLGKICFIHMDKIIVFSDTIEQHKKDLYKIRNISKKYNIFLDWNASQVAKEKVNAFGVIYPRSTPSSYI